MKKNLFTLLSITVIFLGGCTNSNGTKINPNNRISDDGTSIEQVFNSQMDEAQYIQDLEKFLSYDVSLNTDGTPYVSTILLNADFDKNSSIQGGLDFSRKNILKSQDLESIDIKYNLETEQNQDNVEPVYSSGDVTLLYQNDEMYANLHNFGLFMGEENMTAKMYTLLGDTVKDKWVNLDVNDGGIISVNKDENIKIPYIMRTLKNVLNSTWINEDSPNFENGVSELIDVIDSHIDLGVSTNELRLLAHETSYFEMSDKSIQKEFTGSFKGKESSFDLSFIVSKKGLDVHLYNIKEYDEDMQNYKDIDSESLFSVQENKKSEYAVNFQSIKYQQNVANIQGKIKNSEVVGFSLDFDLNPINIKMSQKISGKVKGEMKKENLSSNEIFPELSGEIISFNELVSSL